MSYDLYEQERRVIDEARAHLEAGLENFDAVAHVLAEPCVAMETAGKAEDWDRIEMRIGELEPLFEAVRREVAAL